MQYIGLILLVFAFVFFCIASRTANPDWNKLVALGLACLVAAELFGGVVSVFHLGPH